MKKALAIAALACLSLVAGTIPNAKQYSLTLAQPVQAGSVKLAAGDYKLKVDGANATFVDSHKKSVSVPVKVEKITKKPDTTAIETKDVSGVLQLTAIDLGGADFKLVF